MTDDPTVPNMRIINTELTERDRSATRPQMNCPTIIATGRNAISTPSSAAVIPILVTKVGKNAMGAFRPNAVRKQ